MFLFATNGGDNSVSSFSVGKNGKLTLLDVKSTGNVVKGRSGTAKSLAYSPLTGMLYVLHSFGPDHVRLMSVDQFGKLNPRSKGYTVNTQDKTDRVATQAVLTPNGKFLFVGTTFDVPIILSGTYPDGSPILWVKGPNGKWKSIASNAPDPDGLAVFPVNENGTLGPVRFHDTQGGSPFYNAFLHSHPDTFIIGYAVGDGIAIGHIDADGEIGIGSLAPIDTSRGKPAEVCWLAVSPDDKFVFATNFGYGYISSFRIDGTRIVVAKDPACPVVSGDGTARGLCGDITSGPSDNWLTPDGAYLYQIYGNASKLVGYAVQQEGSLKEITSARIPYNSPQGLAGF